VTEESIESATSKLEAPTRDLIVRFLTEMTAEGCTIQRPDAQKPDYVNVQPPPGSRRGRVCAVHRSTGRVELQAESYAMATDAGVAPRFKHLPPGNKAALTPRSDTDLDALLRVARAWVASRAAG
jgi:hypothetical protein